MTEPLQYTFAPLLLIAGTAVEAADHFGLSNVDSCVAGAEEVLSGVLDEQVRNSVYIGIAAVDRDLEVLRYVLGCLVEVAGGGTAVVAVERGAADGPGASEVTEILREFSGFSTHGIQRFGRTLCLWLAGEAETAGSKPRLAEGGSDLFRALDQSDGSEAAEFVEAAAEARSGQIAQASSRELAAASEEVRRLRNRLKVEQKRRRRLRRSFAQLQKSGWVRAGRSVGRWVGRAADLLHVRPGVLLALLGTAVLLSLGTAGVGLAADAASPVAVAVVTAGFLITSVVTIVALVAHSRKSLVLLDGRLSRLERAVRANARSRREDCRRTRKSLTRLEKVVRKQRGDEARFEAVSRVEEIVRRQSSDLAQIFDVVTDARDTVTETAPLLNGMAERLTNEFERSRSAELPQWFRDFEQRYIRRTVVERQQMQAVANLHALARTSAAVPFMGGWAASPDVLLFLVDEMVALRPNTVVECGSGVSTLWFALVIREQSLPTRVVALEHDERYVAKTRSLLARHGVAHLADVRHAPLVQLPDGSDLWYDTQEIEDLADVGLVFVDGPPASTSARARLPAAPVLLRRLAKVSTIVLDDLVRDEEKQVAALWREQLTDFTYEELSVEKGAAVFRRGSSPAL